MKVPESGAQASAGRHQFVMPPRRDAWDTHAGFVALSLVVIALLAALAIASVNVLGALRAYVGGESLWSKARSDAVQHLRDFALSRSPADYAAFERALAVPRGDQTAREDMLGGHPDLAVVRQGLLEGGNHPDDIDGMITLFSRFGDQPVLQEALHAWAHGDALLAQLRAEARRLHESASEPADGAMVLASLEAVRELDEELVQTEKRFSAALSQLSRLTEKVLVGSTLFAAVMLALFSLVMVRHSLRRQEAHRQALVFANEPWMLAAAVAELGLFEMDIGAEAITLDARAASLYGLGPGSMTLSRERLRDLIVAQDQPTVRAAYTGTLQSGHTFTAVYRIRRSDGALRHLESTGHLIEGRRPGAQRLVGVVRDITDERARAERAMQRDAAEKVAQSQRDFLSRLSHELRTPLNAILGFAQLLLMDRTHALDATQGQRVKMMLEAGQQLLSMVEDVLDLSKVESGDIGMALLPVEVAPLWRASAAMIDSLRAQHNVSFIDRLPTEALWVRADAQRLSQVFVNLLTNACKYNRPGGHLVVEAWVEEAQPFVVIEFSDDGIGMSPEDLVQLFQPFKRLAPQAERIEGTGLGLYIVKQLVERMNGRIEVHSELGQGSRFTLRLPQAQAPAA